MARHTTSLAAPASHEPPRRACAEPFRSRPASILQILRSNLGLARGGSGRPCLFWLNSRCPTASEPSCFAPHSDSFPRYVVKGPVIANQPPQVIACPRRRSPEAFRIRILTYAVLGGVQPSDPWRSVWGSISASFRILRNRPLPSGFPGWIGTVGHRPSGCR